MTNYMFQRIINDLKHHEFVEDQKTPYDEIVEFHATGLKITIIQDDQNFSLLQKCLSSSANVFLEEMKGTHKFCTPKISVMMNGTMCIKIPFVGNERYEKRMKIRNEDLESQTND